MIPDLGWKIIIDELKLIEGAFGLTNNNVEKSEKLPFDLSSLSLQDIQMEIVEISLDSVLNLKFNQLTTTDDQLIQLHQLVGEMSITKNEIVLDDEIEYWS